MSSARSPDLSGRPPNPRKGAMKLLLTSAGIKNATIERALVDLLGKPIAESSALCIPTAGYAAPGGGERAYRLITGTAGTPLCEFGWKSLGVLELTALTTIDDAVWGPALRAADALLVGGGDPMYLAHWMRESGLANRLSSLTDTVYVGVSAGSMVLAPRVGDDFVSWQAPGGGDRTLGIVDFSIFPHLDHPDLPDNCLANAVTWAAGLGGPAYGIDDQTAIRVTGGAPEVISEGHWQHFAS
jgi:dipeptidase E